MDQKNRSVAFTASPLTVGLRLVRRSIVLLFYGSMALWVSSSPVLGQGCAMCRTSLAGQAGSTIEAFNLGILVLLFPPLILMSSIVIIAFRHDQD